MESLYFTDGKKRIDMVLAFEDHDENPKKVKKREVFEKHLRDQGLHLELETKSVRFFLFLKQDARITQNNLLIFIKVIEKTPLVSDALIFMIIGYEVRFNSMNILDVRGQKDQFSQGACTNQHS